MFVGFCGGFVGLGWAFDVALVWGRRRLIGGRIAGSYRGLVFLCIIGRYRKRFESTV